MLVGRNFLRIEFSNTLDGCNRVKKIMAVKENSPRLFVLPRKRLRWYG